MTLDNVLKKIARIIAVITVGYHIYLGIFGLVMPLANYAISFSMLTSLVFFYVPFKGVGRKITLFDISLSVISLFIGFYIFWNYHDIAFRPTMMGELTNFEFALGITMILIVLESTRRTIGMPLVIIALVGIIYCSFGHHLPGLFSHGKFSYSDIVETFCFTLDGILGTPIAVVATLVIQFVMFGSFLKASGAAKFFVDISMSLFGMMKGAAGHIGNFAAALFGMMSGSPTADTATVGSFMIPMMKSNGFSPIFAGAITSVACTGAALMPPVMGTAAFLMAEMTGIPYGNICKAAFFPALLYFLSTALIVNFEASKTGIAGYKKDELPQFLKTVPIGFQYIVPILTLIILLMKGYAPALCAVTASILILISSFFRKTTRINLFRLLDTLESTVRTSLSVVTSCACAGIVVGSIVLTGLGGKFTSIVVLMAGKSLFLALCLTMVSALVLGMGMPLPVVYILTAVLCGPAIMSLGIPMLSAHLFLVYFAAISAVTPPVAVAAYAAAAIAEDNPIKMGFAAFRYAIPGFIIPFVMVYDPSILFQGTIFNILIAITSGVLGVFALCSGVSGWLFTRLGYAENAIMIVGGFLLIFPEKLSSIVAVCLVLPVLYINRRKKYNNHRLTGENVY
ncbi:TRAP transporter, 4TM/12TM fusion protein [Desulfosarcina cetonica]|uniref:TRAP transporter permease n=1 Tax=Desulfosarcina cetonica TaxID=90730 RepID=UPI0006D18943|nr:TRAP transporter fused permease subunit [Desulfosarcina cetonica]VTR70323.1 TRAP transporter, 4TM/12TM fusion protein [Desulfosarcina cetonica]